jgi:enoyl-[acyl-carrier protein] reductase III
MTKEYFDFKGKSALVTGGSRGIGAAISKILADLGCHVFINYREDIDSAEKTKREIVKNGGSTQLIQANILQSSEIKELFQKISEAGTLDFLVHNAAIGSFKPVFDLRPNQWDFTLGVNARALLLCSQQASILMKGRNGRIVSISSLGSQRYVPNYGAIGISKAALESLTRYLAVELSSFKININSICAGVIDTESIRRHPDFEEIARETIKRTPGGRLGTVDDVAGAVVFLLSPLANWINGQTIIADGGFSISM